VAVKQQNVDRLEQMVYDMSTPGHASYGQHLSGQEVLDIVRPKAEASGIVLNWLRVGLA
jgi:tripeptidyl-peptidase-1